MLQITVVDSVCGPSNNINLFPHVTAFISFHSFKSPTEAWHFTCIFSASWQVVTRVLFSQSLVTLPTLMVTTPRPCDQSSVEEGWW